MQYKPVELYKLAFKAALGRDKEKALHGHELIKHYVDNGDELNQAGVKGVFKAAGMMPAMDVDKGGANAYTIAYHLQFTDIKLTWQPPLTVTYGLVLYAEHVLRKRNFL